MTQVTLHVGAPKTGTTSIQHALDGNRDLLAEHGIFYPRFGQLKNHHVLQPAVWDRADRNCLEMAGGDAAKASRRAAEGWRALTEECRARRPEQVILSSELFFSSMTERESARLAERLTQMSRRPRILVYLRDPVDHCLSILQQRLKRRRIDALGSPRPVMGTLRSYQRVVQRRDLDIRVYDRSRLRNGDSVADFLHAVGLPGGLELRSFTPVNETLSAEAMVVLNTHGLRTRASSRLTMHFQSKLLQSVTALDQQIAGRLRPRFRPDVHDALTCLAEDALRLRDGFGIEFASLDYSRIGARPDLDPTGLTRIDEICEVDRDRQTEIERRLPRLLRWAFGGRRLVGRV